MELTLERKWLTDKSTIGELSVDGTYECVILEPPKLYQGQENVPDKTCVPEGAYYVILAFSPKHKRVTPLLVGVPGRTEVEIHIGNFPQDTLGCLLAGLDHGEDEVSGSTLAFGELFAKMSGANQAGEKLRITIYRTPQALDPGA